MKVTTRSSLTRLTASLVILLAVNISHGQDQEAVTTVPTATSETLSPAVQKEMVERMRKEFALIVGEYGNPRFTFIFSNDPEQAADMGRKTDILRLVEPLDKEIEKRNRELVTLNADLEATKRCLQDIEPSKEELEQLQDAIASANAELEATIERLRRLRKAVAAADEVLAATGAAEE